jgi:hypothetical protein
MRGLTNCRQALENRRQSHRRMVSPAVEVLDQRALLSAGLGVPLAGSTNIASFAPEFHDISVGAQHRR